MTTEVEFPANRRERKKLETRAALEQAALRLFGEKGYEQTTVEEIAEAADVAVRTFFRYFSSKQHVLFGDVGHDRVTRLRSELAARPQGEPILTSIRLVLDAMDRVGAEEQEQIMLRFRLLERQPSLVPMYLRLNNELRETVAEFVSSRSGLDAHRHPYPLMVASAMAASWDVALHVWAGTDGSRLLSSLRREVFDTLAVGLTEPPQPAGNST